MSELAPPPLYGLLYETLTWLEAPKMALYAPLLMALKRGPSKRIWVLPGFGASDTSTLMLRRFLTLQGHHVKGWQQGVNDGDVLGAVEEMGAQIVAEFEQTGTPIVLIGWSLGGIISREVARGNPDAISQVFTLGSPAKGGPKYTSIASQLEELGTSGDEIEAMMIAREATPIRVPVTSIYSKYDGIVAWQACIDDYSPDVEHFEVLTTHIGLGFSLEVYRLIATRLAA